MRFLCDLLCDVIWFVLCVFLIVCGNSMRLRVLFAICCMSLYDVRFVYAFFVCVFLRLFCACVLCV